VDLPEYSLNQVAAALQQVDDGLAKRKQPERGARVLGQLAGCLDVVGRAKAAFSRSRLMAA